MKRALRTRWAARIGYARTFNFDANHFESLDFWHYLRIVRMYGVRL